MYWTSTTPAALLTAADVMGHLRIDDPTQSSYIDTLIAAATAHAEQVMASSLIRRTMTATFYAGETLYLPRGPVTAVTSVLSDSPLSPVSFCRLERWGLRDVLFVNGGMTQPFDVPVTVTAVYTAGYGPLPADVPADITQAIRCHVGLLYEQREAATDRTITPVPFIEDFYRLRSREVGIG